MLEKIKNLTKKIFSYIGKGFNLFIYYGDIGYQKLVFFLNDDDWNSNRIWKRVNRKRYLRELHRVRHNDEIRLSKLEVLQRQELDKIKKTSEENAKRNRKIDQ